MISSTGDLIWVMPTEGVFMVKINGQQHDVAGKTVTEVLDQLNFNSKRVAVERNLEIIPKACYETETFNYGDEVEIVTFMGGG